MIHTLISPREQAQFIRGQIPPSGIFLGHDWRISPEPFALEPELVRELELLGRVLLQFYRASNLLYRKSVEGKQPEWVARWLELGKPRELIELQRAPAFKNEWPRVIRPDLLLTEEGLAIAELDSVPGGIGLTAWLNQTYSKIASGESSSTPLESAAKTAELDENQRAAKEIIGGSDGPLRGFAGIFGEANQVHVVLSEEASTYRPEMTWLCQQMNGSDKRFHLRDVHFADFQEGDAVYRFFELFDLANVANAHNIFERARQKTIRLTPPPKTFLEEKMLSALLWNRNLRSFWHQELGENFFLRLQRLTPYSWVVDPSPLPPHGAIPELNLTDWHQLQSLSQRERNLVLKISGFSDKAWGARGVYLANDLSGADWSAAVKQALASFPHSPYVLQRYHKPKVVEGHWYDFAQNGLVLMPGRVRLCPYYFVHGEGDEARAILGGVLATICPLDKKIIHGMRDAILAPCAIQGQPVKSRSVERRDGSGPI